MTVHELIWELDAMPGEAQIVFRLGPDTVESEDPITAVELDNGIVVLKTS